MRFCIWLCFASYDPRKQSVPEKFKEGPVVGTLFVHVTSENGWVNCELFIQWFQFFLKVIPPTRPVLLIMDGHGSHISIEVIELARDNGIHLLCLPAHTTHILHPLDVGVFNQTFQRLVPDIFQITPVKLLQMTDRPLLLVKLGATHLLH